MFSLFLVSRRKSRSAPVLLCFRAELALRRGRKYSHREGVCVFASDFLLILLRYNTRRRLLFNCAPLRDNQDLFACRHSIAPLNQYKHAHHAHGKRAGVSMDRPRFDRFSYDTFVRQRRRLASAATGESVRTHLFIDQRATCQRRMRRKSSKYVHSIHCSTRNSINTELRTIIDALSSSFAAILCIIYFRLAFWSTIKIR